MVPVQPDGGAKIIAIRPDVKIPDRLETPQAVVLATPFAVALMAEVDFQLADRNDEGGEEAAAIFKGAQRLRDDTQ